MATIVHTRVQTKNMKAFVAQWSPIALGDTCEDIDFSQYTDRSVQVSGVFGGATIALQGSNNGTDWATLTDPQGNPLLISSAKIEQVSEITQYVKPTLTGGDGTTALAVNLLVKE